MFVILLSETDSYKVFIISPVVQLLQKTDWEISRMIKIEYTGEILNELKANGINAY